MYNKEALKRVEFLYSKLNLELDILTKKKALIDRISDAIKNNAFDEEWEKHLVLLERKF